MGKAKNSTCTKQKVMAYDIISYILEVVQLNSTVSIRNISNRHSKTKNSNTIPYYTRAARIGRKTRNKISTSLLNWIIKILGMS